MHPGDHEVVDSEWGDRVELRTSADPFEETVFLHVYDSDNHVHADLALDPRTASTLGTKLVSAAFANVEQQRA